MALPGLGIEHRHRVERAVRPAVIVDGGQKLWEAVDPGEGAPIPLGLQIHPHSAFAVHPDVSPVALLEPFHGLQHRNPFPRVLKAYEGLGGSCG